MKKAFIFPGQGSQKVGMGKPLYNAFPAARAVFEEVDDALSQNLSHLIFNGPAEDLTLTENTQPALMTVSLSIMKVLEVESNKSLQEMCRYVAGHSLGEYAALAAAGALGVATAAQLLKIRGQAMQQAVPVGQGAMAAVLGVDFATAQMIAAQAQEQAGADQICVAANDNAPGQVVLSGTTGAIDIACLLAKDHGAKRAIKLPVSAPFHSPLIQAAADRMAEVLAKVEMAAPVVPLIANVTAEQVTQPVEIKKLLVQQVTGMVRWRESMDNLATLGVETMVEVGAGKVLAGLMKRINGDVATFSVETPADIEEFLKENA